MERAGSPLKQPSLAKLHQLVAQFSSDVGIQSRIIRPNGGGVVVRSINLMQDVQIHNRFYLITDPFQLRRDDFPTTFQLRHKSLNNLPALSLHKWLPRIRTFPEVERVAHHRSLSVYRSTNFNTRADTFYLCKVIIIVKIILPLSKK